MSQSKVKKNDQIAQKHSHSCNANGIICKAKAKLIVDYRRATIILMKLNQNGMALFVLKVKIREKICVVYVCNVNLWLCVFREDRKTTIYFITFNCYNFTILLVCDSIRFKQNRKGILFSRWLGEAKLWWRIIIIILIIINV